MDHLPIAQYIYNYLITYIFAGDFFQGQTIEWLGKTQNLDVVLASSTTIILICLVLFLLISLFVFIFKLFAGLFFVR